MSVTNHLEIVETQGIEVYSFRADLAKGRVWTSETDPGFYFGILTEGTLETRQDVGHQQSWLPNDAVHFTAQDSVVTEHESMLDGQMSAVFMRVKLDIAEGLLGEEAARLIDRAYGNHIPYACTTLSQTLAWQILGCPMSGPARKLYITSRALEILSCLIEHNSALEGPRRTSGNLLLSSADVERIHAARGILLDNLASPPTVPELARQIGVNTRKLNEGFAQLFGTTVYAFVKSQRLHHAKLLLETGAMNVGQVAHQLGYHPAHLSAEFRKTFGMPPSKVIPRRSH